MKALFLKLKLTMGKLKILLNNNALYPLRPRYPLLEGKLRILISINALRHPLNRTTSKGKLRILLLINAFKTLLGKLRRYKIVTLFKNQKGFFTKIFLCSY